jgi:hypothetical protein
MTITPFSKEKTSNMLYGNKTKIKTYWFIFFASEHISVVLIVIQCGNAIFCTNA